MIINYGGSVIVNGVESKRYLNKFYENIGVDFEFFSLYEKLIVIENLKYFGFLYFKKLLFIDELLKLVGLENEVNKRVFEYLKGMKFWLNFIKVLLYNLDILFLDELISGFDLLNSKVMKDIILLEKLKGKIIILIIYNMLDVIEFCDRVVFIVNGKIFVLDILYNFIMLKGVIKVRYIYFDNGEKIVECFLNNIVNDKNLNMFIEKNKFLLIYSSELILNDIFIEIIGRNL